MRKGPSYFYRTGNGIAARMRKTVAHCDREGARKIRKAVKALWPDQKVVLVKVLKRK